jgi:CCR4-NOT transcription complex subunit 1
MEQLENTIEVQDIMEELGYSCTVGVAQCKEILCLLPSLSETNIARIIAMVSRSHSGLEDSHGTCGTFYSALAGSTFADGVWANTWNTEVLVESIKLVVSWC